MLHEWTGDVDGRKLLTVYLRIFWGWGNVELCDFYKNFYEIFC